MSHRLGFSKYVELEKENMRLARENNDQFALVESLVNLGRFADNVQYKGYIQSENELYNDFLKSNNYKYFNEALSIIDEFKSFDSFYYKSKKALIYSNIAYAHYDYTMLDSSLFYYNKSANLYKDLNLKSKYAQIKMKINYSKYMSALYSDRVLENESKILQDYSPNHAHSILNRAKAQDEGSILKAYKNYEKSILDFLDISKKDKSVSLEFKYKGWDSLIRLYFGHWDQSIKVLKDLDYKKAIDALDQISDLIEAKELPHSLRDKLSLSTWYFYVYRYSYNFDEALKHFESLSKLKGYGAGSNNYSEVAEMYFIESDYEESIYWHKKSLDWIEVSEKSASVKLFNNLDTNNSLGFCYLELDDYEQADYYFEKSYNIFKKAVARQKFSAVSQMKDLEEQFIIYYYEIIYLIGKGLINNKAEFKNKLKLMLFDFSEFRKNQINENLITKKWVGHHLKSMYRFNYIDKLYIFEITKDNFWIEDAYKDIENIVENIQPNLKDKFLNYSIPKSIIEKHNIIFKK